MSCNGASSRVGAWGAATAVFAPRIASEPNVPNASAPMANNFFMSPPEDDFSSAFFLLINSIESDSFSALRLDHATRGWFVIVRGSGDIIAVQLGRPE